MSLLGVLCSRHSVRLGTSVQRLQSVTPAKWLTTSSCLKSQPLNPEEGFWEKNKRLERPVSPHLSIYKPQITWLLSGTHRATGIGLSTLMSGFAIGMLALPHNYAHYFTLLSSSPSGTACLFAGKFILAFPFFFHFTNGIRHLAWDLGKGFQLKEVYTSGYTVLATTLVLTSLAAAM